MKTFEIPVRVVINTTVSIKATSLKEAKQKLENDMTDAQIADAAAWGIKIEGGGDVEVEIV